MTEKQSVSGGDIVVYQPPDGEAQVDVRVERETVWLSLTQMAELFERDKSVISRHLRNVFRSGELERAAAGRAGPRRDRAGRRAPGADAHLPGARHRRATSS